MAIRDAEGAPRVGDGRLRRGLSDFLPFIVRVAYAVDDPVADESEGMFTKHVTEIASAIQYEYLLHERAAPESWLAWKYALPRFINRRFE